MTFPNGGQRDEGHPNRKVPRYIDAPSPADKRRLDLITYEEMGEYASVEGFDMPSPPSGKGRNIKSGRKPS